MKNLNKIQINPEKLLKNSELVSLKGGYDGGTSYCTCRNSNDEIICGSSEIGCPGCGNWCFSFCPGATSSVCAALW